MVTKEQVIEVLKQIEDPEIHVDVWTLELIYKLEVKNGNVKILMTYTTPACPYGPALLAEIRQQIKKLKGVKSVKIDVTFEPQWKPSDDLKAAMGLI